MENDEIGGGPPGPGWWMASDGRWYPPELHPWFRPAPPPLPPPPDITPPPAGRWPPRLLIPLAAVIAVLVVVAVAVTTRPTRRTVVGAPRDAARTGGGDEAGTEPSTTAPQAQTVTAAPSVPGVAVDPSEATSVATQLWQLRMTARYQRNIPQLRAVETGPALEADIGYVCQLGCRGPYLTASAVVVSVARQPSWPASFFATVTYTTGCNASASPCDDTFVAVQPTRDAPWRVALYVTFSGNPYASRPDATGDGYARPAADANRHLGQLPQEYAAYLTALKQSGHPPAATRLGPGPFTTDEASQLYDPPSAQAARGEQHTVTYTVSPSDPVWELAMSYGTTATCGTVRFRDDVRPTPGHVLTQPADVSNYGNLAPGKYQSVTMVGLHMVCFESHPTASEPVAVFGTWGDLTGSTGIAASS